jgi:sulfonate transport system substrate-binding protein
VAARGQVDFAFEGSSGALSGRADGLANRLLMVVHGSSSGFRYLVVPTNSPVHTVAQLKGHRLATVKLTGHHMTILRFLQKYGIRENEVELVDRRTDAGVVSSVVAGECDATFMWMPFDLVAQGKLRVLLDTGHDADVADTGLFWVSLEFEQRYPGIVQRLMTALVKTAAWNSDERNRRAVFELWSKPDNTIAAVEANWAGLTLKERVSPLMDDFFMATLRRRAAEERQFGFIKSAVTVDDWVEPKYLQEALKELHLEGFWPERDATGKAKTVK